MDSIYYVTFQFKTTLIILLEEQHFTYGLIFNIYFILLYHTISIIYFPDWFYLKLCGQVDKAQVNPDNEYIIFYSIFIIVLYIFLIDFKVLIFFSKIGSIYNKCIKGYLPVYLNFNSVICATILLLIKVYIYDIIASKKSSLNNYTIICIFAKQNVFTFLWLYYVNIKIFKFYNHKYCIRYFILALGRKGSPTLISLLSHDKSDFD